MSQEHCEIHDCDATNGCAQCIANKQATCTHGGLNCRECGLEYDALRASIRQQFEAAGFDVAERVRVMVPAGTREQLLARLALYPPDQLLFVVSSNLARPALFRRSELVSLIEQIEGCDDWNDIHVRAVSSSQIWPA